jgi:hypothetical protein
MLARRVLTSLAIGLAATGAWSRDVTYDFVVCGHARETMLEASADIVALGFEQWGVVASSTTKEWEGATTRCVGAMRLIAGRPVGKGLCKWFNTAGDTAVGEWEYPAGGDAKWTWLAGTGGLKGITGTGTFMTVVRGKPAEAGTSQSCRRDWGQYSLP